MKDSNIESALTSSPPKKGRVIRAVFNYGLGGYLPNLIGFLLVPLFTRYIVPTEMGILEICMTAQALVVVFMRLGLQGAISRFYFDHREGDALRDLVTTIVYAVAGASIIITAVGFLIGPFLFARFLPEIPFHPYMDLALVTALFQGAPEFQRRLLQAREKSAFSARLSIAYGLLNTTFDLLLVIKFKMGGVGLLYSNLISAVVFALGAWFYQRNDLRGNFSPTKLKSSLAYGLPLVPHHAAAWSQQFIGRWVLGSVATAAMVGNLGLASKVVSPLLIVNGAFASAYSPVYFSWRSTLASDAALVESRRIARTVLVLGVIGVIGAATYGSFVVRYAMQKSYADAAPLVAPLAASCFAQLVYTLLAVEVFYSKGIVKWISAVFIISSGANLILILLFARQYGAMAAAYAQLAGGIVSIGMVSLLSVRTFALPLSSRVVLVAVGGTAAACCLTAIMPVSGIFIDFAQNAVAFVCLTGLVLILSGTLQQIRLDATSFVHGRFGRSVPDVSLNNSQLDA